MWRNKSILLVRGEATRDGNVDRLGREILDGFRANGWMAADIVPPAADPGSTLAKVVERIARGEFDLVLSVQDMGMFGGPQLDRIFAQGRARRLYWALDHPYSCYTSVAQLPAHSIVAYPTRGNLDCCQQYLRADLDLHCVAHASASRDALPWSERQIEALFVGNAPATPPEQTRAGWPQQYPQLWSAVLEAMAQRFDPATSQSLDGLAESVLRERSIDPVSVARENFMLLLSLFDAYAWAVARLAFVTALRGLPITLIGRGWDAMAGGRTTARGPMPGDASRRLMNEAKLVLNILPTWYRSHERVFEGMAAGAAVATTGQGIFANATGTEYDPADEEILLPLGAPDQVHDRLGALLGNEAELRRRAEAGFVEQRHAHSWAHRVKALLDRIEAQG